MVLPVYVELLYHPDDQLLDLEGNSVIISQCVPSRNWLASPYSPQFALLYLIHSFVSY